MRSFSLLVIVFLALVTKAQTTPEIIHATPAIKYDSTAEKDLVATYVEQMPEFSGGDQALMKYLSNNIVYPASALRDTVEGRVMIKFVVGKNGQIRDAEVVKHLTTDLDAEALRVVRNMPAWKPGRQNGRAVSVSYMLPVKFVLK
jgi:protein TonB